MVERGGGDGCLGCSRWFASFMVEHGDGDSRLGTTSRNAELVGLRRFCFRVLGRRSRFRGDVGEHGGGSRLVERTIRNTDDMDVGR